MKAFIALFALAAAAKAEADPALVYTTAGHAGIIPYSGVWGAGHPMIHYLGKRSADADAWYGAYTGYGYPAAYGLGYGLHYGKREAEADPALVYAGYPAVVSHSGLVAHPNGAVTPDYTPSQKLAAAQHLTAKAASWPYVYHYGKRSADADAWYGAYTGYGLPAYTTGYHYLGKRSADADAWYGAYTGYGYPAAYTGLPMYHAYGKRSAEAEANPWSIWSTGYLPSYSTPSFYPYGHYLN